MRNARRARALPTGFIRNPFCDEKMTYNEENGTVTHPAK